MQMRTKWLQHDVVTVEIDIPCYFSTQLMFVSYQLCCMNSREMSIVLIVLATFLFIKCSHYID